MCGFVMTPETAAAWASRITGKEWDPYRNIPTVWEIILKKVQPIESTLRMWERLREETIWLSLSRHGSKDIRTWIRRLFRNSRKVTKRL